MYRQPAAGAVATKRAGNVAAMNELMSEPIEVMVGGPAEPLRCWLLLQKLGALADAVSRRKLGQLLLDIVKLCLGVWIGTVVEQVPLLVYRVLDVLSNQCH